MKNRNTERTGVQQGVLMLTWAALFALAAVARTIGKGELAHYLGWWFRSGVTLMFVFFGLMYMPYLTGVFGLSKKMMADWLKVLLAPLAVGILYFLLFHESILRFWYQGPFDSQYIIGLLKAFFIVAGLSFLVGLVVSKVLRKVLR